MNPHISSVLKKAQDHLASWLLPLLGTSLSGGVLWAESYLARQVSDPTDIWLIRAISVSVLLLFLLAGLWFYHRPKFKHIPSIGVHENIKTGAYFCSFCYLTKKLESPLNKTNAGLSCPACFKSIYTQEYLNEITNVKTKNNWRI